MAGQPVGAALTSVQATDLMFVERAGVLNEMLASALGIDHQTVNKVNGVTTVSLWRSADESVLFSSFPVADGADGSGNSVANYNSSTAYTVNQTATYLGVWCRARGNTTGDTPFVINASSPFDYQENVNWEVLPMGGVALIHDPEKDYTPSDIVMVGNKFYVPNDNITASPASPVPFVIGTGTEEWRNLIDEVGLQKTIHINGADVDLTTLNTHTEFHFETTDNATITTANVTGGELYRIYNTRSAGGNTITFTGFTSIYIRGRAVTAAIAGAVVGLQFGEYLELTVTENSGNYFANITYGSGHRGWILAESYHRDEAVINPADGLTYFANTAIEASTAFVIGLLSKQWRLPETELQGIKVLTAGELLMDGVDYYIDASGGPITLTIDSNLNSITLTDYGNTWTDTNFVDLVVGTDTIRFGIGQAAQRFSIIRVGGIFRAYGTDSVIAEGTV